MYKYVSSDVGINILSSKSFYTNKQHTEEHSSIHQMKEFHQQLCNDVDGLVPAEEGGLIEGWTLQGKEKLVFYSETE